jgi:hypothetical protein
LETFTKRLNEDKKTHNIVIRKPEHRRKLLSAYHTAAGTGSGDFYLTGSSTTNLLKHPTKLLTQMNSSNQLLPNDEDDDDLEEPVARANEVMLN